MVYSRLFPIFPAAVATALVLSLVVPTSLFAWSEHSLATRPALAVMPEIAGAEKVPVETLEDFLEAEADGLVKLLETEETWARENVPGYPVRPVELAFKTEGDLRANFLKALRLHPGIKLLYWLQTEPGKSPGKRPGLHYMKVSVYNDPYFLKATDFRTVKPGEKVAPLEVVTMGSDEPDLGHDIGVWENNETEWGAVYNFGTQPFGNPQFEYSSQAPFHMGFFQESWILYAAAPVIKRTFPEYRIHLYQSLARFAFETGHPYWGYRFLGWGMHYVGDLTMPYHSRVVPGVNSLYLIWVNLKHMLGYSDSYNETINLVSNRHTALESYQRGLMTHALRTGQADHPVLEAARDIENDQRFGKWQDDTAREIVSRGAEARADEIDGLLEEWMPERFVSDPDFKFGPDREQTFAKVSAETPEAAEPMSKILEDLFRDFGTHSRNYARSVLPAGGD